MNERRNSAILLAAGVLSAALLMLHPHGTLSLLPVLAVMAACLTAKASRWVQGVVLAGILVVAVPMAGIQNSFLFELGTQIGIYAALALGLNIVVGMAGLLDLGYAGFFGLGAYTWAIFGSPQANELLAGNHFPLAGWPYFYLFVVLAVMVAALTGVLIGLPALRLRGDYLAVVTLGLGQVVRLLANNLDHPLNITNGPQGISPIERPPIGWLTHGLDTLGIHVPPVLGYSIFFYFLVLAIAGAVVLISTRLDRSRFGRAWVAIREDEMAAQSVGISVIKAKVLAFATGAAFSGAMGAVFAAKQLFVSPDSFTFLQSITILVMVLLGGMGSIRGAILGAAAVTLLNIEILKNLSDSLNSLRQSGFVLDLGFLRYDFASIPSQLEPAKYERMIFGLIIVLMMIFRPSGLIPEQRHRLELEGKE
ncbi:MAG: branched-chain amino acid ABC transporter permease [Lentisphaerae bacterium RIFOXYB12_FULL_65_16]|nr:MAG: branched-chain amino acid ABC transporter permease [Lentisphaerae bacterium RIFOXYA12_64_32]OGV86876.1 MAG: branched-chain amino acid ABC transporter permease [Lentisphaerae bacterium RIFOXYB12_FULL_65_16]